MSYIGNTNTTQGFIPAIDYFSGNGSTVAFTLSRPVASVAQVQANISNVPQNPSSAFSVSGNTITFTSAPPSGTNNIYVYYTSPITQVIAPSQGTVTSESFGTIVNFTTTGNTILGDASTDTLNVGNGGLVKDASGNVGIGTASPAVKLDVSGGSLRINEDGAGTKIITMRSNYASLGPAINVTTNDPLLFLTNNTERMRIDSSGNVGIGTSSPNSRLTIVDAADLLADFNSTGANGGYMVWRTSGSVIADLGTAKNCFGGSASADTFAINARGARALLFGTNNTERMRIDSSGNLLVGTTTAISTGRFVLKAPATSNLGEWRVTTNGYAMIMYNASDTQVGYIAINASTTTYNTGSDYRLKENIAPMTGALAKVAQLKPCTYTWKATGEDGQGFIAHELSEVVPDAVSGEKDAVDEKGNPRYQGVDTSFLVATLTAAIQEQQAIITSLTDRITLLENK